MHTVEELSRILGLTVRQVRERLYALDKVDGLLTGQVRKEWKGRKEYSPAVLAMLRDMQGLSVNLGKDLRSAAEEIAAEVHGNSDDQPSVLSGKGVNLSPHAQLAARVELLEARLADKEQVLEEVRHDRDSWKGLALSLQAQLALPAPKPRRRWWPFIRKHRS